jgi:hypothetical protein
LFERLIPYLDRPRNVTGWNTCDFDNFKFIIMEMFLYTTAILLRAGRFLSVSEILNNKFYSEFNVDYGRDPMQHFFIFWNPLESFDHRNRRLNLGRTSLLADTLEKRSRSSNFPFRSLMEADFFLFFRDSMLALRDKRHQGWWPDTLIYASRSPTPFEIFARSESARYFAKVMTIFEIQQKEELRPALDAFKQGILGSPKFGYVTYSPEQLLNYQKLASDL